MGHFAFPIFFVLGCVCWGAFWFGVNELSYWLENRCYIGRNRRKPK